MYNPLVGSTYDDLEGGKYGGGDASYEFAESSVRQGFVRKVFGLLAVQLAVTVGGIAAFMFSKPVKEFVAYNPWTLWTSLGLSLALILVLTCSEQARRSHPTNLIMLMMFTLCESVLLGAASATYDTRVVLLAVGITTAVVVALALFATQSKLDLTASGGALLALLFSLLFASVLQAFIHASWLELGISVGGAVLFSVYLVFDIQLMMGSGSVALSPDEYVYAALALYLDVINLFLYILRLLNELSRND